MLAAGRLQKRNVQKSLFGRIWQILPVFRLNSGRFPNRLSIPSVVLAEASWYGSIRAGWTSASGPKDTSDAKHKGAGVRQFGSRWGIKGTSEVSDGLSAVYKFETRIGEGEASQDTDQLYVGLGGGFGTVSMGKLPAAGNVHVGFVDNSTFLGGNAELLANKQGSVISYASPSIGGFSFQVDAQGDRSAHDKDVNAAQFGATMQIGDNAKVGIGYVDRATKGADNPVAKKAAGLYYKKDKTADGHDADNTQALAETAGASCMGALNSNCAYSAAVEADDTAHIDDDRTAMIAGHYAIGGMSLHLGYGQRKWDTDSKAAKYEALKDDAGTATVFENRLPGYHSGLAGGDLLDKKQKTTFFGVGGGIGDTGVSFFLQVENTKTDSNKVTHSYRDTLAAAAKDGILTGNVGSYMLASGKTTADATKAGVQFVGTTVRDLGEVANTATTDNANDVTPNNDAQSKADDARGSEETSVKNTPFVLGVSRSLGGGASIHLEHANKDSDTSHNVTALFLKVDF